MKILVLGFGRMGISHSTILSGLLGARNARFEVIDTKFMNRFLAKQILSDVLTRKSVWDHQRATFDLGLMCTPPFDREPMYKMMQKSCSRIFVEKPLRQIGMRQCDMSGYVLQHLPIFNYLPSLQLNSPIIGHIEVKSNLDFSVLRGWRSTAAGNIVSEFLGHAMTFGMTILKKIFNVEELIANFQIIERQKNLFKLSVHANNYSFDIILSGNAEVRKTEYICKMKCGPSEINITPYDYNDGNHYFSIADYGVSTPYFVRGFEYSNQMQRFLSGKGDVLKTQTIIGIEEILEQVVDG